jgi:signal transduction histidine kinase
VTIEANNDWREWLCKTVVLRNIAGRFRGVFFTAVDITEQLQKKRLSNWAQIAHDMQTNLSTIKLNAEQIDCEQFPDIHKKKERILHQVKLLILRVRDIITVGRSDKPDFAKHDISRICDEVLSEFDDTMFPQIEFINNTRSITLICDKAKLIRAIRNAVENGIKAIGENSGKIELLANKLDNMVSITVKDSGKGMDAETMQKMNIPYFTTAKNSGGSGIGTMIMQHVAELHRGRIVIHSEIGKGTELTFELPIIPSKFIGKFDV